ncbi:MAG: CHASE2 domain-containing protein [Fulvivirga sp.]
MIIIMVYQFIDINLFKIYPPRSVNSDLFKVFRNDLGFELEIVLLDIKDTHLDSVKDYIELLETYKPKSIGVNLCNSEDKSEILNSYLIGNQNIVTCDCQPNSDKGTSKIISPKNQVTHFKTDKDSYFEIQLSDKPNELKERNNEVERINYRAEDRYVTAQLSEVERMDSEFLKGKTILIGFLQDSLVTPMNYWYDSNKNIIGDMSDTQISANIISTINRNEFINEVPLVIKMLIILIISLFCAGVIRLVRTKYLILDILLGLTILIALNLLSGYIIVFAFSKNYYLQLHEMATVLIVISILSIYWNIKDKHVSLPNINPPTQD